jgi:hypothetical protein
MLPETRKRDLVQELGAIEEEIRKLENEKENLKSKILKLRNEAEKKRIEVFRALKVGNFSKVRKLETELAFLDRQEFRLVQQTRRIQVDIANLAQKFNEIYEFLSQNDPLTDADYKYVLKKGGYKNPGSSQSIELLKTNLRERLKTPEEDYEKQIATVQAAIEKLRRAVELGNAGAKEGLHIAQEQLKFLQEQRRAFREEEELKIRKIREEIEAAKEFTPEVLKEEFLSKKRKYEIQNYAGALAAALKSVIPYAGRAAKPTIVMIIGILLVIGVFAFLYMFVYLPRQTTLNAWIRAAFNELQEQIGYQSCRFTALLQAQNPDVVCRPPEVVEAYEEILSYTATGPELVVVKQTIPYEINYILQKPKSLAPNIAPVKNLQLKKIEVRNDRNRCVYRWPSEVLCDDNPIVEVIPQTESCVSAACDLNKNKDKEAASVWLKWANDDVIWCKFCEGKSKTRSFYTYFETEYEYTAPGTAKQIVFSTSEILPPSPQVSKVNVGPVSVDIVASNAYIFKANTPTIPALISIKLKNNGDGTAKIKQVVIEQIKDPEAEFIVFNAEDCTENNVENSGSKTTFTFEEGKIILKPKGGYTLVQCKVDLTNIRNSAKLNEVGHLSYTLKPSVSYSYTIRRQVNTAIDQRCELVKLSEPEKEEEICKQFA